MRIGVLYLDLLIPGARSLKDRRRVVKGLKQQLRNRFNCSVAEIGCHELWGRAKLAVCVISNESRHANTQLNAIAAFSANKRDVDMIAYEIEML